MKHGAGDGTAAVLAPTLLSMLCQYMNTRQPQQNEFASRGSVVHQMLTKLRVLQNSQVVGDLA